MSKHDFSHLNDDEFVDLIVGLTSLIGEHDNEVFKKARVGLFSFLHDKKIPKSLQFSNTTNCTFDCAEFTYTNDMCCSNFIHQERNTQISLFLEKFNKKKEKRSE